MKNILALLLLVPCILFAQKKLVKKTTTTKKKTEQLIKENPSEETILTAKDFVSRSGKTYNNRNSILLNDGSDTPVDTKFLFGAPDEKFKILGLEQIKLIIHISNLETISKMKNKYTYQPRKVSMFYSDDKKEWNCAIEYTSQNDYGALKNGTVFYTYDDEGNEPLKIDGY